MNLTAMKFKSICAAKEILIVHIGWDGTVTGSKLIMLLLHCIWQVFLPVAVPYWGKAESNQTLLRVDLVCHVCLYNELSPTILRSY